MDKLFDETMDTLVMCGTVCLRRLATIVMADIKVSTVLVRLPLIVISCYDVCAGTACASVFTFVAR